jgi:hypothetical protein
METGAGPPTTAHGSATWVVTSEQLSPHRRSYSRIDGRRSSQEPRCPTGTPHRCVSANDSCVRRRRNSPPPNSTLALSVAASSAVDARESSEQRPKGRRLRLFASGSPNPRASVVASAVGCASMPTRGEAPALGAPPVRGPERRRGEMESWGSGPASQRKTRKESELQVGPARQCRLACG